MLKNQKFPKLEFQNAGPCIILQSQKYLKMKKEKTEKVPEYIKRNATYFQRFNNSISDYNHMMIYLKIYDMFSPIMLKHQTNFQKLLINVERTLFYLERQFDQVYLEDVLDYVIPEFLITDDLRNE